jgi:hypothetical protein
VTVKADQLQALQSELNAVLDRWRSAGDGDNTARRVQLAWVAHPSDLEADPPQLGGGVER